MGGPSTAKQVAETPDVAGHEIRAAVLPGQTRAEGRRALVVEEILGKADTITSTDFGPVHVSESAKGARFIVGKFGEDAGSSGAPSADITLFRGRVVEAKIPDPSIFIKGHEPGVDPNSRAADAVIMALLNAIDKR